MGIFFHSFPKKITVPGKTEIKNWLKLIISDNKRKVGDINIVFVKDADLLEMNKKFLKHNYYTDILTFNFSENARISGDIYISLERVQENAIKFNCSLRSEFLRVIIHGIFHLLGFNDQTKKQKKIIHQLEDAAIGRFPVSRDN